MDKAGYKQLHLYKNGVSRRFKVYHLVAHEFIGPRPHGHHVNHIDATPSNNRAVNLEYVTPSGNMQHCLKMGRRKVGHAVNTSKLTESDVLLIRKLLASGVSGYRLAKRFGVSFHTIYSIRDREIWKHI
jgi:hypothetical protein